MKKFILDYKTWRSGADSDNQTFAVGEGNTFLLNSQGFMCCLGQFSHQCGIPRTYLLEVSEPDDLASGYNRKSLDLKVLRRKIPFFVDEKGVNTSLTDKAIAINDHTAMRPALKIFNLQKLFARHGFTVVPKNLPPEIAKDLREIRSKWPKIVIKKQVPSKSKV